IASTNERVPRFSVYQLGRGKDPIMVVGRIFPAVAFNISALSAQSAAVLFYAPSFRRPAVASATAMRSSLYGSFTNLHSLLKTIVPRLAESNGAQFGMPL